jgi:Kef-type K+ transport system, predicted NAD-binding component
MSILGISPGLGTFLIGIVLSNSKYRHAIAAELEPFKGLLLGLFFITVGAGINFNLLYNELFEIITITIVVIIIKSVIIFGLAKIFLAQRNTAILLSLGLSQAGEFGFVLISLSKTAHVLPILLADKLAVAIALSMLITPILLISLQKFNVIPKVVHKKLKPNK